MVPELICTSCGVKGDGPHERWCLVPSVHFLGKNMKFKYRGKHRKGG